METVIAAPSAPEKAKRPEAFAGIVANVTRQAGAVLFGKGAFFMIGLGLNILLARILGPAALGQFQLGLVVVQLAANFSVLGQDKGLMRYLPVLESRAPESRRRLLTGSVWFVTIWSAVLGTALYFFAPQIAEHYFHTPAMTETIRLYSIYLPILALVTLTAAGVVALKRADYSSAVTNMVWPAANLVLLLAVVVLGGSLMGSVLARTISHAVALVLLLVFLFRHLPAGRAALPASHSFGKFLSFSAPLWLIGLSYYLLGQLDIIMLGHFVGEREVGVYSVAVRLSALVAVAIEIVLPILAPLFSELSEKEDHDAMRDLFRSVTKWIFYSALIASSVLMVFRVELLKLFGAGFAAGAPLILILCIGQLFRSFGGPTGQILIMTGKQKWEILNTVSLLAVNLVLNWILVPRWGVIGAAISTASTITAISILKAVQVYVIYRFHAFSRGHIKGVLAISVGCAISYLMRAWMVGAGFPAAATVAIAGAALIGVVGLGLWLLGLDPEDRMALAALRLRKARRPVVTESEG